MALTHQQIELAVTTTFLILHGLEFHHRIPFADGGPTTVENLELRSTCIRPSAGSRPQLTLDGNSIGFYAPDRAVVTSGNSRGNPVEFIRKPDGTIGWVRVVGRIARKD